VATNVVQGDLTEVPGTDHVIGTGTAGYLWRWDMSSGRLVATGRSRDTTSLYGSDITRDGTLVAALQPFTASIALFDAATLRPVGRPFPVRDRSFAPTFTPDGRGLLGDGLFGATRWETDPDEWRRLACLAAGRNMTRAEWAEYTAGSQPYRRTCAMWPSAP
jgi:hypothetical protein